MLLTEWVKHSIAVPANKCRVEKKGDKKINISTYLNKNQLFAGAVTFFYMFLSPFSENGHLLAQRQR